MLSDATERVVTTSDEEALHRLVHGELRGPEAQRLRERMVHDSALAARYGELEAAWSALGESLPVPPTPNLAAAVRSRLHEPPRGAFGVLRESAYGGALAAAMLLVGAGTGWWVQSLWHARDALAAEAPTQMAQAETAVEEPTTVARRSPSETAPISAAEAPVEQQPSPSASRVEPPRREEPLRVAAASRPLDEDFEVWSETLGDEPEWNDQLFSSSVDELLAASEQTESVEGWDESIADGWGLPSPSSMAAAYLGLEETVGGD